MYSGRRVFSPGKASPDHVAQHRPVAGHGVHAPVLQVQQREIDRVVLRERDARTLLHDELRRRVDLDADRSPGQIVRPGDGAVALHDDLLAGRDIRIRKQHRRGALGRDGHGRDDDVEAAVLKRGEDAVETGVDELSFDAELPGHRPGDVHVEAAELAAFRDAKRWIRRVDPDTQPSTGAHAFERRRGA